MEDPEYNIGLRYVDITKTMWFTFFYCPVIPIGTLFSFLGMVFYYFADKYVLIYRRTVKESIGAEISFQMVELLEYSIVLHCFGNFIFKWMFAKYLDLTSLILFFISVLITILPLSSLKHFLDAPEKDQEDISALKQKYSEFELDFDTVKKFD